MSKKSAFKFVAIFVMAGLPIILAQPVYAAGSIAQVEGFIQSIIRIVSGLAGLIATGFFVVGGLGYITSSGHPERLERAKQTLIYSGIGLAIVIAAFVISSIIVEVATNAFGK